MTPERFDHLLSLVGLMLKKVALQPIAQVTDIGLRFPVDVKHFYIIAQVTYYITSCKYAISSFT
jgi:hypothetical protein